MNRAHVLAVSVGQPQSYGWENAPDPMDQLWTTSFFKNPVEGTRWLGTLNIEGDGQADLKNHGGADKAVLVYSAEHYPDWKRELPDVQFGYGGFAENLSVSQLTEHTVCVGDVYAVGDAVLEVCQPRIPCWKISRRWRVKDLTLRVQQSRRTGWYCRVLQEAEIGSGLEMVLLERPWPAWTIERCNYLLHEDRRNLAAARELSALSPLAEVWKLKMTQRANALSETESPGR